LHYDGPLRVVPGCAGLVSVAIGQSGAARALSVRFRKRQAARRHRPLQLDEGAFGDRAAGAQGPQSRGRISRHRTPPLRLQRQRWSPLRGRVLTRRRHRAASHGVFQAGRDAVALAKNAHFVALEGSATYSVLIRDAFVPDDDVLSDDAAHFIPRIRKGFVLLQAGMGPGAARGAATSMRADAPRRRLAAFLPLGPDEIDARTDALSKRVRAQTADPQATDHSAFLEILKTRLDVSWLALEAAQAAMLQAGGRGYSSAPRHHAACANRSSSRS
jgi:hypothetical protein